MKLYIESLLTSKVLNMMLINMLLVVIIMFFLSNGNVSNHIQLQHHETFLIDYLHQGVLFIKINIVLLSIVLVYQTRYIKGILSLDTINHKRSTVIIKYYLVLILVLIVNIMVYYLIFEITGVYLTVYIKEVDSGLFIGLLLFGLFSITLMLCLYLYFEHIYTLLFVLLGYFIVIVNTGFFLTYKEVSLFTKVMHLYVSDLVLMSDLEYSFLYSEAYTISLVLALIVVLVRRFSKIDLM